jgi:hypothetical protein
VASTTSCSTLNKLAVFWTLTLPHKKDYMINPCDAFLFARNKRDFVQGATDPQPEPPTKTVYSEHIISFKRPFSLVVVDTYVGLSLFVLIFILM